MKPCCHFLSKRRLRNCTLLGLAAVMSACITINIYFPAAAAEKAADKVIDEIWQTLPDGQGPNANPPTVTPGQTTPPPAENGGQP